MYTFFTVYMGVRPVNKIVNKYRYINKLNCLLAERVACRSLLTIIDFYWRLKVVGLRISALSTHSFRHTRLAGTYASKWDVDSMPLKGLHVNWAPYTQRSIGTLAVCARLNNGHTLHMITALLTDSLSGTAPVDVVKVFPLSKICVYCPGRLKALVLRSSARMCNEQQANI